MGPALQGICMQIDQPVGFMFNSLRSGDIYHASLNGVINGSGLLSVQHQVSEQTSADVLLDRLLEHSMKFKSKYKHFHARKCIWKCCLQNGSHFTKGSSCWCSCCHGFMGIPGSHVTNSSWAHYWNIMKENGFDFKWDDPVRSQICTCHNSSAVVTCTKL